MRPNKGVPAHRLSYMVHVQYPKEPASWKEVEELPTAEKQKWIQAANEEMKSLKDL